WSPDGSVIAYRAQTCNATPHRGLYGDTRLVTPSGRDITPTAYADPCDGIGSDKWPVPAWSPDGRLLAINTGVGLYLGKRDGTDLRRVAPAAGGVNGDARPAWQPDALGSTK